MVETCGSGICLLIQAQWQVLFASCACNRHLYVYMLLFRVSSETCCVVWMYVRVVLIIILKMLKTLVLSSQQWGDELLLLPCISDSLGGDKNIQGSFYYLLPGFSLVQCAWMAKRQHGSYSSFLLWCTLSQILDPWLQRSYSELSDFSPGLCWRADSLINKRLLGSC